MCLLIVELLFFVAGASMLGTGKIPQGMFRLLFGGKYFYKMEPSQARKLGAWLVWPFPLGLLLGFGVQALNAEETLLMLTLGESFVVILVALVALWVVRQNRRARLEAEPEEPSTNL